MHFRGRRPIARAEGVLSLSFSLAHAAARHGRTPAAQPRDDDDVLRRGVLDGRIAGVPVLPVHVPVERAPEIAYACGCFSYYMLLPFTKIEAPTCPTCFSNFFARVLSNFET